MEKHSLRPIDASLVLDGGKDPTDFVRSDAFRSWLEGSQPYLRTQILPFPVAVRPLIPADFVVERCSVGDSGVDAIARSTSSTIGIDSNVSRTVIRVTAPSDDRAELILSTVLAAAEAFRDECADTRVTFRTWFSLRSGDATWLQRKVPTRPWQSIRCNYTRTTRGLLDPLMERGAPPSGGRLLLWHGEPGTGKTTALGALAHAWQSWCSAAYITDPEKLFEDAGYLATVLTTPVRSAESPTLDSAGGETRLAQLLIAEDSDEYLRSTARREAGAALGRLLNLTDGLLGLGTQTFVLLTTNEEVTRLHPAVTRPGRCLASIEFEAFSSAEAAEWLGAAGRGTARGKATLAQLLQRRGDFGHAAVSPLNPHLGTGTYL